MMDAAAIGYKILLDCTYRSNAEQDADYEQGRLKPGPIITHARAGQSAHNCVLLDGVTPAARAFDIAIYTRGGTSLDWVAGDKSWKDIQQIGRGYVDSAGNPLLALGCDWPEPKTDGPHFELANWESLLPVG